MNNNSDFNSILNFDRELKASSLDPASRHILNSYDTNHIASCIANDIQNNPNNGFWNGVSGQMELNNIMTNVVLTKGADIPNTLMGSFLSSANEQFRTRTGEEKTLRSAVGIISGGLCAGNLVVPNPVSSAGCIVGGVLLASEIVEARIHAEYCKENGKFSQQKYDHYTELNKKDNTYTPSYIPHPIQSISGYSSNMSKSDTMQALLNQKMRK
jgi:hypothetical protein